MCQNPPKIHYQNKNKIIKIIFYNKYPLISEASQPVSAFLLEETGILNYRFSLLWASCLFFPIQWKVSRPIMSFFLWHRRLEILCILFLLRKAYIPVFCYIVCFDIKCDWRVFLPSMSSKFSISSICVN